MYTRKTKDVFEIQGRYAGYWETVTEEDNRKDALAQLKCYDANEPQYPHRIVKRRVKIESNA